MSGRSVQAVAVAAIIGLTAASSPAGETTSPSGFLRVEWHVTELREPVHFKLEGYVYNDSPVRLTDVRLRVVERDSAARAVGEAWGWVFGDVPAGGSAYFVVPLETTADAYDVSVVSFDAVARDVEAP